MYVCIYMYIYMIYLYVYASNPIICRDRIGTKPWTFPFLPSSSSSSSSPASHHQTT